MKFDNFHAGHFDSLRQLTRVGEAANRLRKSLGIVAIEQIDQTVFQSSDVEGVDNVDYLLLRRHHGSPSQGTGIDDK